MTFSQLRLNSPIYILHKDATPYVECGQVVNVTAPMPQVGMLPQIGQPVNYTVDLTVKVGDMTSLYQKLPANGDVADFANNGSVFLACARDGINAEVQAMRQRSADIVASIDYHKNVIGVCDKILQQINPEVAEKMQQQEEIKSLKEQISSLMGLISEMRGERASSE